MERLWAPWRIGYITSDKPLGCIFCERPRAGDDRANFILWRGQSNYVMLNAYPYNNGHLMVVPYEHCGRLEDLPDRTLHELMELTRTASHILTAEFDCEGLNLGMNLGSAGGAGFADHVHMHVVPRWGGDTNFMTTAAEVRVIPQSLEDAHAVLRPAFERALGNKS
ncbi:MAG: HIT domain-containing protein [Thermoleophilia bacterium]